MVYRYLMTQDLKNCVNFSSIVEPELQRAETLTAVVLKSVFRIRISKRFASWIRICLKIADQDPAACKLVLRAKIQALFYLIYIYTLYVYMFIYIYMYRYILYICTVYV
jgi:hypothetical protein